MIGCRAVKCNNVDFIICHIVKETVDDTQSIDGITRKNIFFDVLLLYVFLHRFRCDLM